MKNTKKALSVIYQEQAGSLYSYGCKFTRDSELVKDCIHDVFVKLYEKEDLSSIQNMKFYLLRAFKNRLLDGLSEAPVKPVDDTLFSYMLEPSGEDRFIADDETRQIRSYIEKAFEGLTGRQKEAVYLYYIEELEYGEIEQLLDMNYQSVRNIVHRALNRLREQLGEKPPPFLFYYLRAELFWGLE